MLRRIFIVLAILAGIGVIVLSQLKLREHIQGIINEREDLRTKLGTETKRRETAERDRDQARTQLADVTGRLRRTTESLEKAQADAAQAASARDKAMADLRQSREAEKAALQRIAKFDALGLTVEQILALQDTYKKALQKEAVMAEETKMLSQNIAKLKNYIKKIEAQDDEYQAPLPPGLKGTIQAVDPKYAFVVLNIGEKQGVLRDGVMMVHRGSKLVGKVRITNVMPDRCIANMILGWRLADLQEGDQVMAMVSEKPF